MEEVRKAPIGGVWEFVQTVRIDLKHFFGAASETSREFRYGRLLGAYMLAAPLRGLLRPPREADTHHHGKGARA